MEALFGLVVLLAIGGSFVAFVVLLVVLGQRQAQASRERFARSVEALGLTLQGTHEAVAVRDGVGVRVQLTSESRGSGKHRRRVNVTRYYAYPDPPLRMGLELSEQTAILGDLLDFAGLSSDVVLGDPALDAALRIKAIEPDHARAVLREPTVGPPVLEACRIGRFALADGQAFLQHDGWALDAPQLGARLGCLHRATHALIAARRRWRATWEHALDASWGAIATTEGLTYDATRSQIYGRVADTSVQVVVTTEKGALVTRAEARFDPPLGLGLSVYRTGVAENVGKLFGAQDVQVGVAAFDAAFTVKARDEAGARRALGGEAAEAIVRIATIARAVSADDAGIRVQLDGVAHDARAVGTVVRALAEAARGMRGVGGAVPAGAYR
ncbi:hypothetical protein [Sandaracinus amylolyticus]|uniref:Uncharacterized protein n=1 Tax=Sandaracinus amylolyticus TaxID=927083 RepID=A0A0F6W769_9BACT|nr:hypothetical protein [Sandaracinus amylolyticus]AKF09052.1 hypothetical protein DB32_006201 [Sandaracinus amylolyticus]